MFRVTVRHSTVPLDSHPFSDPATRKKSIATTVCHAKLATSHAA